MHRKVGIKAGNCWWYRLWWIFKRGPPTQSPYREIDDVRASVSHAIYRFFVFDVSTYSQYFVENFSLCWRSNIWETWVICVSWKEYRGKCRWLPHFPQGIVPRCRPRLGSFLDVPYFAWSTLRVEPQEKYGCRKLRGACRAGLSPPSADCERVRKDECYEKLLLEYVRYFWILSCLQKSKFINIFFSNRLLSAGSKLNLALSVVDGNGKSACDILEIAVDGIYLDRGTPPRLGRSFLFSSARTDWLIVCETPGEYYVSLQTIFYFICFS